MGRSGKKILRVGFLRKRRPTLTEQKKGPSWEKLPPSPHALKKKSLGGQRTVDRPASREDRREFRRRKTESENTGVQIGLRKRAILGVQLPLFLQEGADVFGRIRKVAERRSSSDRSGNRSYQGGPGRKSRAPKGRCRLKKKFLEWGKKGWLSAAGGEGQNDISITEEDAQKRVHFENEMK